MKNIFLIKVSLSITKIYCSIPHHHPRSWIWSNRFVYTISANNTMRKGKNNNGKRKKKELDVVKNKKNQDIPEIIYPAVIIVPKSRGGRAIYCFNCYTTNNNIWNIHNIGFTPDVFVQCLWNTTGITNRWRWKHSSWCLERKPNRHDLYLNSELTREKIDVL